MKASFLRTMRLPLTLAASALVVMSILLIPSTALGVQVAVSIPGATTSFPLGSTIPATLVLTLADGEFVGASSNPNVQLVIAGPQPVTFADLPLQPGPFGPINVNGAILSGTVSHSGIETGTFGYGYGYGYRANVVGATITYNLSFTHRILLSPAPLLLPVLPGTSSLHTLAFPGAIGGGGGGFGGPSTFPTFDFLGSAFAPGTPFDSAARGLDVRPGSPDPVIGVVLDGFIGGPDIYAQFAVGPGFIFPEASWSLPAVGTLAMDTIQGFDYVSASRFAVVGGTGPGSFLAVFDFTGGSPPTGAVVAATGGSDQIRALPFAPGKRPGGVTFDASTSRFLVTEFEDDPSATASILALPASDIATSSITTHAVALGPIGKPGFDGYGFDPNNPRAFAVTAPASPIAIVELSGGTTPVATHFPENGGGSIVDAVTGLGIVDDPATGDGTSLMFIVKRDTKDILVSKLPPPGAGAGAGEFTNEPVAIDRDGAGNHLLLLEGSPFRLGKLSASFASPVVLSLGTDVTDAGGAVFVPGANANAGYWIADNSGAQVQLRKINTSTGATIGTPITLPFFVGAIGGLAGREEAVTVFLYAAARDGADTIYKVNTDTGSITQTLNVFDSSFFDPFFPPFGINGLSIGNVNGTDVLLAARFSNIFTINLTTGALTGGFFVGGAFDIQGLGAGSILIADQGFPDNRILGARLPGEAAPDITTAGNYTMQASVENASVTTNSASVNFSLTKLAAVVITISTPSSDNQAFTSSPITIAGSVNDPTVSTIIVAQGLAEGTIVGGPTSPSTFDGASAAADQAQYARTGLWHFSSTLPGITTGTVAYYGQGEPAAPNYDTFGTPNDGNFETPQFTIGGTNTAVQLDVWYHTEPGFEFDKKLIQWCPAAGPCQTVAQIVDVLPAPFGGGFFPPPPGFGTPGQTFTGPGGVPAVFVPNARPFPGAPTKELTHLTLSLASFNGQTGKLRIRFDTVDGFGNFDEGLVIDNLEVTGPKTVGQSFPVTNKSFSFPVDIAEGANTTTLVASSGVPGTADGTATRTTFLDTAVPVVTLNAVTSPTQATAQTLSGTYTESNPQALEIRVNGNLVVNQKTFTSTTGIDAAWSHLVGLTLGTNSINVQMLDSAGRTSVPQVATILVDQTVPLVQAAIRPILSDTGVRAGDPFFVLVNAVDTGSVDTGIGSVKHSLGGAAFAAGSAVTHAAVGAVPQVIVKKHGLGTFNPATTHVYMAVLPAGTPSGSFPVHVQAADGAGNVANVTTNVDVVASLGDRSAYLLDGFNFVGFPLIPTTAALDSLMDANVTNAKPSLVTLLGRTPKLSDIVETVLAWPGGLPSASPVNDFVNWSPVAADTFTSLSPFIGLLVKVRSNVVVASGNSDVFDTAFDPVAGATVKVPVKWNVGGQFLNPGATPPSMLMVTGWDLWTPHAQDALLFELALRGALIPLPLAVSAITQVNRIDAVPSSASAGGFTTQLEQAFTSTFPAGTLQPMRAYWTFMNGNATITP